MNAKQIIIDSLKILGIYAKDSNATTETAGTIINAALIRIGIANPSATNTTNGVGFLNDLLAEWAYDGISFPYTKAVFSSTVVGVPDWALSALKTNLAVRLASQYSKEPSQALMMELQTSNEKLAKRTNETNLATGLTILNDMMIEWGEGGIRIGYLNPQSLTDESGIPDWALAAVKYNLAIRLAPVVERQVSSEAALTARDALRSVKRKTVKPIEMDYPSTLPMGAGNRSSAYSRKTYGSASDLLIDENIAANNNEGSTVGVQ